MIFNFETDLVSVKKEIFVVESVLQANKCSITHEHLLGCLVLAVWHYRFLLLAVFEYKNDSVIEVDKWGYYHCNASKSIVVFNNGRSIFNLDRPGPFYFISGAPNHCKNGQRLIVEVMGLHHQRSHSPPPIATPPYSFQLAPSSQTSSGAAVFVRLVSVLVVLLATLVALPRSS